MLSIITITYNNLCGLQKTARNIQSQTNQDFEWVIIDGESRDGTPEFLKTLNALSISEADSGIYDAMNKGLGYITRDYVIFMNAGDQFAEKDTIERLYKTITGNDYPDFIFGPSLEQRKDQEPVQKNAFSLQYLSWGMVTHHQAMVFKSIKNNNLKYNITYNIAADYDFLCRFTYGSKKVHMTLYPICLFEAGGISQRAVTTGRKEQFMIRKDLKICGPAQNHLIYSLQSLTMLLRHASPGLYWFLRRLIKK